MVEHVSTADFQKVISAFISKMGFRIESAEMLEDGSIDFLALTQNPMGGNVVSLIRASAYMRLVKGDDIEHLAEKMETVSAVRAAYITTSGFSEEAVEEARERPISLINKYQLMDSIEKRGLAQDKDLMRSLESFGMGEKHFQGVEQSFSVSQRREEIKPYFDQRAKKGEKAVKPVLRYAPLEVYKVTSLGNLHSHENTIRGIETKDYLFINLNNLDLYYIVKKRKRSGTERLLMRSDIISKIYDLPAGPKESLFHLLDHGDLPLDTLNDRELAILKNKNVIEVYEGKRRAGGSLEMLQDALNGLLETINIVISEVTSGIGSMGEGGGPPEKPPKEEEKNVAASVNMPHLYGGIYDIWKYLDTMRGVKSSGEMDNMKYTSKVVSELLASLFSAHVTTEGIIFMPYYRTKYVDEDSNAVIKYEVLYAPKFKDIKKTEGEKEKKGDSRKTNVGGRHSSHAGAFKLIR